MNNASSQSATISVQITPPPKPGYETILTQSALQFVGELAQRFSERLRSLVAARQNRATLAQLAETAAIRDGDWRAAPLPADLRRRKVEITGPVDRKMVINALNSGADMFMADFEDSSTPTFSNMVDGQINLRDAVAREITYDDPGTQKHYELSTTPATLLVRPRGLHLTEKHCLVNGTPIPGAIFDFGLYFFHNAKALIASGSGPYFYLPKLENHLEAELWNDIFVAAQKLLGIPVGTIKATVLIETLPAAFQMDEILHALRDHSAGLNCGRWDYIFSFIKTQKDNPQAVMPDRSQVTMEQPCMRAYTQLVVRTCHRRGVHAMGGMAAQIPIKADPDANARALDKVRADKLREVKDGHDGTWVAHPGLVPLAREVFDAHVAGDNQLDVMREDVRFDAAQLLAIPQGPRTEEGLRLNIRVGIQYIEAWLRGQGCVPLYNLMEDAATAEISRTQIWQWIRHGAQLDDGRQVTGTLLAALVTEEMERIASKVGAEHFSAGRFAEAQHFFTELCTAPELAPFLTLGAYEML